MKKILIQLFLFVAIVALGWVLVMQFYTPIQFEQIRKEREVHVIERLMDIRTAQQTYRAKHSTFTPNFDSLVHFILNDSLQYEMVIGQEDDSVAVAQGLVKREFRWLPVRDTVRFLTVSLNNLNELRYIPFSDVVTENTEGTARKLQFVMDTASIRTESSVVVPVFEAFASYPTFLGDLDKQELINFRDYRVKTLRRDDGLKVGSLTATTNEAGNWE